MFPNGFSLDFGWLWIPGTFTAADPQGSLAVGLIQIKALGKFGGEREKWEEVGRPGEKKNGINVRGKRHFFTWSAQKKIKEHLEFKGQRKFHFMEIPKRKFLWVKNVGFFPPSFFPNI